MAIKYGDTEMMKITNTWKHSLIAIWGGTICGAAHRFLWWIDPASKQTMYLWWMIIFAGTILMLNVERNQFLSTKVKRLDGESLIKYYKRWYTIGIKPYIKERGLDTLVDIAVGIASMFAGLLPWWIL